MEYVAGLLFSQNGEEVALVRKNRPAWQNGKLNAIGGKIEEGEYPHAAMVREFHEEAGLLLVGWRHVATLEGNDFKVHFFSLFSDEIYNAKTMEDEPVAIYVVREVVEDSSLIGNLPTIIALTKDRSGIVKPVQLSEVIR